MQGISACQKPGTSEVLFVQAVETTSVPDPPYLRNVADDLRKHTERKL